MRRQPVTTLVERVIKIVAHEKKKLYNVITKMRTDALGKTLAGGGRPLLQHYYCSQ